MGDRAAPKKRAVTAFGQVDELVGQLAIGGRLVAPVGAANGQTLLQLTRQADGSIVREELAPVSFVPLLPGMLD